MLTEDVVNIMQLQINLNFRARDTINFYELILMFNKIYYHSFNENYNNS